VYAGTHCIACTEAKELIGIFRAVGEMSTHWPVSPQFPLQSISVLIQSFGRTWAFGEKSSIRPATKIFWLSINEALIASSFSQDKTKFLPFKKTSGGFVHIKILYILFKLSRYFVIRSTSKSHRILQSNTENIVTFQETRLI
jgi:hypothetical protein